MHPRRHDSVLTRPAAVLALAVAALLLIPDASRGSASGEVRRGNKAYRQERYEEALEAYRRAQLEDPDLAPLHFNIGNVHYRRERWDEALKEFELSQAGGDSALSARAFYNTGNTLFRQQNLPAAAEAYKSSLELDPADMDARYNLELVTKLIEQQQGQQQQQQQQQEQDQEQDQEQGQQEQQQEQEEQSSSDQQEQQREEEQEQEQQQEKQQEQEQQQDEPSREDQEAPQPQPGEMTPEEAAQLLNAIREQEEKTQEERRAARVQEGRRGEYDW